MTSNSSSPVPQNAGHPSGSTLADVMLGLARGTWTGIIKILVVLTAVSALGILTLHLLAPIAFEFGPVRVEYPAVAPTPPPTDTTCAILISATELHERTFN